MIFFKRLKFYYLPAAIIMLLLSIRFLLVFSYSIDLDGTEFAFLHNAQLLYKGISVYRHPDYFPFYAVMYTPLYYYLLMWTAKLLSINPIEEVHRLLIVARLINVGLMATNLIVLFKIMTAFKLPKNYSYILLLFFMMLITGHCFSARPDGLKITVYILQLFFILQYFYFNNKKKVFLFIVLCLNVISFLLKQDSVIYSNLVLFLLAVIFRTKESTGLFVLSVIGILISYLICLALFSPSFFINTFIYNFQSITDFKNSYNLIVIYASVLRLSFLLVMCGLGIWYFRKKINRYSFEFLASILIIPLFIISHIFMLKSGAYLNYSFELVIIIILLVAKLLAEYTCIRRLNNTIIFTAILYFMLLISANITLNNYTYNRSQQVAFKQEYFARFVDAKSIKKVIENKAFFLPNASNLVYFASYDSIFYGYDAHVDRFINLYLQLDVTSKLLIASPKKVDDSFLNGSLEFIIIEDNTKSDIHIKKYYPYYSRFAKIGQYIIYRFNPPN